MLKKRWKKYLLFNDNGLSFIFDCGYRVLYKVMYGGICLLFEF